MEPKSPSAVRKKQMEAIGTPRVASRGMRWLLSAYTPRFDPRHKRFGQVFSGRYKALVVDGSGPGYLRAVCD